VSITTRPKVVIVGGGFGGLSAARALWGAPVDITIIDRTNHHLFQPLLYQVATAALSPADIAAPIRNIARGRANVDVMMAEVTGVDTVTQCVQTTGPDLPYDYLVLATGAKYNYFGHPEWEPSAPSLKTIPDATAIRGRVLLAFEAADLETDPARRRALLTFALVGAGPTGVEMAGSIAELAHWALSREFRHIDPGSARILLLEAGDRILDSFAEPLASSALKALERKGVEVLLGSRVESVDELGIVVKGERIDCSTVIWTAGIVATPVAKWLGAGGDRIGRVMVGPDLSVPGRPNVFVIGDAAHVEHNGKPLPGVAPVAMQQGKFVAQAIRASLRGRPASAEFRYLEKGNLATVGRGFAVVEYRGLKLSGVLAWYAWVAIHIWYLIGFRNRFVVMFQWAWAYFTYQRGARLITDADASLSLLLKEAPPPVPESPAVPKETAATPGS
jgi:NADH:ubiquinone reductase (H+-translocating)